MLYAVHTRKIVDPIFGAKLTGIGRARHLRQPDGDRSGARARRGRHRPAVGPREDLAGGARADEPQARQLRRRDRHVHRTGRSTQRRRRRRPQPAPQPVATLHRLRPRVVDHPRRGLARGHRHTAHVRLQLAAGERAGPVRALRSRVRDGHGLPQPRRHHQRLGLRRLQLLSRQDEVPVDPAHLAVHVPAGRTRSHRRRRRDTPASPACD